MIFYNIQALESKLRANELPKRHSFIYALILITISSLGALQFKTDTTTELWVNNVDVLLNSMIFIGFSIYLYNDEGFSEGYHDHKM